LKRTRLFFVLIWLCVAGIPTHADFQWTYYLSPGAVTSIAFDTSAIWCGTEFGLIRWDRSNMTHRIFRIPDGLPHSHIKDLAVAPDGSVWAATEKGGLAVFDGSAWETYDKDTGLSANNAAAIAAAPDGTIYAALYAEGVYDRGEGLSWFDGESWSRSMLTTDAYDPVNRLKDIEISPDETVWTTNWKNVAVFSNSNWAQYPLPDLSGWPLKLATGTNGIIWVWTETGLFRLQDNSFQRIELPEKVNYRNICGIVFHDKDGFFFATKGGGLFQHKDGVFERVAEDSESEWLTTLAIDNNGEIIAGTSDGGFAIFNGAGWDHYKLDSGTTKGILHTVVLDKNNTVWAAGTDGIFRYADNAWETVWEKASMPVHTGGFYASYSLFFDAENNMWVTRSAGPPFVQSDGEWKVPEALSDMAVLWSIPAHIGGLWLVEEEDTEQRLKRFINGDLSNIPLPENLEQNRNYSIVPVSSGPDGSLWCTHGWSFSERLLRYREGEWTYYPSVQQQTAYESTLSGMRYSDDGAVWVSVADNHGTTHNKSYGGRLLRMQPGEDGFTEVLSHEHAVVLHCIDPGGAAWFSTYDYSFDRGRVSHGISRYDGELTSFDELDGLPSDDVRSIAAGPDGSVWIAAVNGACRLHSLTTSIREEITISSPGIAPSTYILMKAFPNPFNPAITIHVELPQAGPVSIAIYNMAGQRIRMLKSGSMDSGPHDLLWDGRDDGGIEMSSGVYITRVVSRDMLGTCRMSLVR
jgi:ligand-binding sensor domain-containing protein